MGSKAFSASTYLGTGIGLRVPHYEALLQRRVPVGFFEAIAENYLGLGEESGGRPRRVLEHICRDYPVVFHGVSLSVGSTDPLNRKYLRKLKALYDTYQPAWVSDHLCWTGVGGENLHDLLPLPYTEEALKHVVERVEAVQEILGRQILLENVSTYVTFGHSQMKEWEFLAEVARRGDCGILLDINNIFVSATNHGFDPEEYLKGIPPERVGQFHLAGHSRNGDLLIDTHDHPVPDGVWALFERALERYGRVSTLVEWDDQIPSLDRLLEEAATAARKQERILGARTDVKTAPAMDAVDYH